MNEVIMFFQWIYLPEAWIALFTLSLLEIVLGIDNIIFLSIVVDKLPKHQQDKARNIGLGLAMIMRLGLLACIAWVMSLTEPLFLLFSYNVSGRDIILILGGLFLIAKSTHEIYETVENTVSETTVTKAATITLGVALTQIVVLDVIFSLDSVITAVGLVDHISLMMVAVVLSVIVMFFAAKSIGIFVNKHPSVKILALAFLILIGFLLLAEGFGYHVSKNFVYGSMAISFIINLLNMKRNKNKTAIKVQTVAEILLDSEIGDILTNNVFRWKVSDKYEEPLYDGSKELRMIVIARAISKENNYYELDDLQNTSNLFEIWSCGIEEHVSMDNLKKE